MEQSGSLYRQEKLSTLYVHTESIHNLSAPRVIAPLVMERIKPASVLDVGCGTGTWLKAFEEHGVSDVLGVDGDHLDRSLLQIAADRFLEKDLRRGFSLGRKFDLVLSLEVAEHLDERCADDHVQTLVDHGDTILFSAAIPGQGGQNHVNEQWPDYWQEKFAKHGFYFNDAIRPQIWNNPQVDWWYRQNIFLVTKKPQPESATGIRSVVHPELYNKILRGQLQYVQSLQSGHQGLNISARIFLRALRYKITSLFQSRK